MCPNLVHSVSGVSSNWQCLEKCAFLDDTLLTVCFSGQSETFQPIVREWTVAKEEEKDMSNAADETSSGTSEEKTDWQKIALCQYLRIPQYQHITE